MARKPVCATVVCTLAILTMQAAGSAAPAASPTATPAAASSEIQVLQAQLKALSQQSPRDETKIRAITERIAELEARRSQAASETGGVATKTTITNDQLQSTNAQNTYDAIKDVPGVTQADTSAAGGSDNLQIRGIKLGSTTGFRLDGGLPIVNNIILSTEDKAQIQVLKGAGAVEYGLASPAGIINYVLKRAEKTPVNTAAISTNEYGQAIGSVDLGRRFGAADEFGVRVNLAGGDTGSFTHDAGGTRWLGALTSDWTTNGTRIRLDYEQFGVNIVEQSGLLLNKPDKSGHITLPSVPDPTQLLSGDWARAVGMGENLSLRGDFQINDDMTLRAEAGRSEGERSRRDTTQITGYNLTTGVGTETVSLIRDQESINTYSDFELKIRGSEGTFLQNALTFGYTLNGRDANNPVNGKVTYQQNIFDPIVLPAPAVPTGPIQYQPQHSADADYFVSDSAVLFDRLRLTGGLRRIDYVADDHPAGAAATHTNISFLAPAAGGFFDVTKNVSFYASYVKSLEETALAPVNATNALALLPPAPSTQKEAGVRVASHSFKASLAYFHIDRANATIDPTTNIFGLNGTNEFQGFESTVGLAAGPRWTVNVGGQYMHAIEHSPNDPTIDGKIPENIPKLSGSLNLGYRPRGVAGLQLTGGIQSVGQRQLNAQDQGTLPSVTTYNLGANYRGKLNGTPVVLNLTCRNLTDKRYFSSIVNGALGVAAPRTISLSLRTSP